MLNKLLKLRLSSWLAWSIEINTASIKDWIYCLCSEDNFSAEGWWYWKQREPPPSVLGYGKHQRSPLDASVNLSILIRNGLGRPQNFSKALFWAWLSFSGGLEKAKAVVEVIIDLVPESAHDAIRLQVFDFLLKIQIDL